MSTSPLKTKAPRRISKIGDMAREDTEVFNRRVDKTAILIVTTVLTHNAIPVSDDSHFQRTTGLTVENRLGA